MSQYKVLDNLMMAYLNEDAIEITHARELPGMLNYYFNDVGKDVYLLLRDDIDDFIAKNDDINTAFREAYADEWNVGPGKDFLLKIKALAEERWDDVQTPINEESQWKQTTRKGSITIQALNALSDHYIVSGAGMIDQWFRRPLLNRRSSHALPRQEENEFFNSLKHIIDNDSLTAEQSMIIANILLTKKAKQNKEIADEDSNPFSKLEIMYPIYFDDKNS